MISVAILPAAPGRLSTMTCWPRASESFYAIGRAVASVPPPGAKPTSMRIGLIGCQSAARTCTVIEAKAMNAPQTNIDTLLCPFFIVVSSMFGNSLF